jgi:hypothetical protein
MTTGKRVDVVEVAAAAAGVVVEVAVVVEAVEVAEGVVETVVGEGVVQVKNSQPAVQYLLSAVLSVGCRYGFGVSQYRAESQGPRLKRKSIRTHHSWDCHSADSPAGSYWHPWCWPKPGRGPGWGAEQLSH